jgi:aspartyl/glutamyl-tRNA(Asn/Gln) amidotransferase C subunit
MDKFQKEFESILDMVDEIQKCDTSDIQASYKSHKFEDLRDDVVGESISQEKALLNSPKSRKGAFAVSQVLEEE